MPVIKRKKKKKKKERIEKSLHLKKNIIYIYIFYFYLVHSCENILIVNFLFNEKSYFQKIKKKRMIICIKIFHIWRTKTQDRYILRIKLRNIFEKNIRNACW